MNSRPAFLRWAWARPDRARSITPESPHRNANRDAPGLGVAGRRRSACWWRALAILLAGREIVDQRKQLLGAAGFAHAGGVFPADDQRRHVCDRVVFGELFGALHVD